MLSFRKTSILVALALLCCAGAAVQAAPELTISSLEPGRFVVRDIIHPLAPQSISQNTDPNTIESNAAIACAGGGITTDNEFWRLFDLDDDHALTGEFCTEDVDFGVETATGPQDLTLNVHCLDEGLPFLDSFLALAGTSTVAQPDAALEFFNVAVAGCCTSETQDMAVSLNTQDCFNGEAPCLQFFPGANSAGQSGPSFISADDCGLLDPTDLAAIGFPDSHTIMIVNGDGDGGTGDGGGQGDGGGTGDGSGVPASTGFGMMLMALVLLGSSAYFLRRKATN